MHLNCCYFCFYFYHFTTYSALDSSLHRLVTYFFCCFRWLFYIHSLSAEDRDGCLLIKKIAIYIGQRMEVVFISGKKLNVAESFTKRSYEIIFFNWLACIDKWHESDRSLNKVKNEATNAEMRFNMKRTSYMDVKYAVLTTAVMNREKKMIQLFSISLPRPMKSIFYPIWDVILAAVFFPRLFSHICTVFISFLLEVTMTITCKRISHCQLTKKKINNVKHSANYYNYFMFNLFMSLYFAETMLVAVAAYNFRSLGLFLFSLYVPFAYIFSNFTEWPWLIATPSHRAWQSQKWSDNLFNDNSSW